MQIVSSFDDKGATIECIALSDEEKAAVEKAKEIVVRRYTEAGAEYGEEQERWMYWCFMAPFGLEASVNLCDMSGRLKSAEGRKWPEQVTQK